MYRAFLHKSIDAPFTTMLPLRLGRVPSDQRSPDAFVTINYNGQPHLRLDAYNEFDGCFRELIIWRSFVVLGWSDVVHLVNLETEQVNSIPCDSYFGHLYPTDNHLLIASSSELICLDAAARELWRCGNLGVDGVLVSTMTDGIITGDGEWDPPGGWRPFRVAFDTGTQLLP